MYGTLHQLSGFFSYFLKVKRMIIDYNSFALIDYNFRIYLFNLTIILEFLFAFKIKHPTKSINTVTTAVSKSIQSYLWNFVYLFLKIN